MCSGAAASLSPPDCSTGFPAEATQVPLPGEHEDGGVIDMDRLKGRFGAALSVLLFFLVGIGPPLARGTEEIDFQPPRDVVFMWAERAGLTVMLVSVAVILFVLVMRRHRLMEGQSKWLLFVGLCVLPIPVTFLSSGVGMEESKGVQFCSSCHKPMGPFVDDMKAPDSKSLAATHYKNWFIQVNQCWTCHSDYGIAGTAGAKLRGLLHIAQGAVGAWERPIKLHHPYRWTICLGCHANSARFKAPRAAGTAHDGVVNAVLKGAAACTGCHHPAHPAPERRASR